jgi:indole-3-glycerol phosphate synthase
MIDRIIQVKKQEIEVLKERIPGRRNKPLIPLRFDGPINIIAELKRRSPSAGFISEIGEERIGLYSKYAKAISVLTDSTFFGGSMEFLAEVADQTPLPVLFKDFVIDPSQVDHAYSAGADIILLIARILEKEELETLYAYAQELGLACLIEVHQAGEMMKLADLHPSIIGVNSRDLDTLQIDMDRAEALLSKVKAPIRIAESGIKTRQDIERLKQANGFLIGETLMRADRIEEVFLELLYD